MDFGYFRLKPADFSGVPAFFFGWLPLTRARNVLYARPQ